jgi:hypothetical protein
MTPIVARLMAVSIVYKTKVVGNVNFCRPAAAAKATTDLAGLTLRSNHVLANKFSQLAFVQGAYLGGGQLTILEEHQGWNTPNTEFGRDFPVVVDIHLGNL